MWATALGEFLATLGLAAYREWAHAQAIRGDERGKLALAAATLANDALRWKADAASRPDGGAELRVRHPDDRIILPGDDPDPHRGPSGDRLPPRLEDP